MSTGLVSSFMELNLYQNQQKMLQGRMPPTSSRMVGSPVHVNSFPRARGFSTSVVPNSSYASPTSSGGSISSLSDAPQHLLNRINQMQPVREIKKIDRSFSLNDMDLDLKNQQQRTNVNINTSRYKTELCRPFEESGFCKYSDKCQFAHGMQELRNLSRHPKYKTDLCRTYHTVGFCPYGPRCHFVHCEEERRLNMNIQALLKQGPPPSMQSMPSVPFNLPLSLGSTGESPESSMSGSPSLSPSILDEMTKSIYSQHFLNSNNNEHLFDDVFTPSQSNTPNSSAPPSPQHCSQSVDYERSCRSPGSVDLAKQFALMDIRIPVFSMPFDD